MDAEHDHGPPVQATGGADAAWRRELDRLPTGVRWVARRGGSEPAVTLTLSRSGVSRRSAEAGPADPHTGTMIHSYIHSGRVRTRLES
jgi:hypothetical protein